MCQHTEACVTVGCGTGVSGYRWNADPAMWPAAPVGLWQLALLAGVAGVSTRHLMTSTLLLWYSAENINKTTNDYVIGVCCV